MKVLVALPSIRGIARLMIDLVRRLELGSAGEVGVSFFALANRGQEEAERVMGVGPVGGQV